MKLKKIVSLALAGVLAVSMLTACGDGTDKKDPASSSEATETVVGYSSEVQKNLSPTATEKVTLTDSAALNDALQAAMEYAANSNIAYWYDTVKYPVVAQVVDNAGRTYARELINATKDLIADMDAENDEWTNVIGALKKLNPTATNYNEKNLNATFLFVVDGGKGVNGVMNEVADLLNAGIEALNKHYEDSTKDKYADYEYTGSVSAYTKTLTGDHDKSLTFIAVNIAREIV